MARSRASFLAASFLLVAACASHTPDESKTAAPATDPVDPAATTDPGTPPPPADARRVAPANGSAGCLRPQAAGLQSGLSITAAGKTRTFLRAVPAGYDPARAYPLVFVFHSGGGTGARTVDYFGFANIAADKAVFLYPDGLSGEWDLDSPADKNPDIAFFDALLEDAKSNLCVDASKVFATGTSMGAYFANQLGCRRGSKLRAIAPHAGSGPYDVDSAYDQDGHLKCPEPPVAAMIFHGENDTNVKLADGQATRDHWAWANGCKGAPVATQPSPCVAYQGCARPVVWCQIPGGTHKMWAQGPQATWDFFAGF